MFFRKFRNYSQHDNLNYTLPDSTAEGNIIIVDKNVHVEKNVADAKVSTLVFN